jgi:hypothetical protein
MNAEEMAVRLMDNLSSHIASDMIGCLTEGRVRVITFAPHTTQIFQLFDVTQFDVFKRRPRYKLAFRDEEVTV